MNARVIPAIGLNLARRCEPVLLAQLYYAERELLFCCGLTWWATSFSVVHCSWAYVAVLMAKSSISAGMSVSFTTAFVDIGQERYSPRAQPSSLEPTRNYEPRKITLRRTRLIISQIWCERAEYMSHI